MDYRQLGRCGLRVSTLTLGTMTFGRSGPFASVGAVDLDGARRQIDLCLDAGVNLIDTADVYSAGVSEELVGEALVGRRDRVLLATKARMPMGDGPNDAGLSRHHLIEGCEASLRRLRTDHIDLYQVHEWDGQTPLEETLDALDDLVRVRQGPLRRLLELRRLAARQGARDLRPPRPASASSASRSTTRCRRARPSTSWCPPRSTRGSGSSCGARWRAACCRASTAATPQPEEGAPPRRLGRAADSRPRAALRHRRRAGGDRRRPRRVGRAGRAGLHARQARRDLARHRRAQGGAARSTTSPRPTSSWRPTSARGSTRSARCRCCTRTGTRPRRRRTASATRT